MDLLTHLLVGRVLAVGLSPALGLLATVFAVLPDADMLARLVPPLGRRFPHRGATHTLLFGAAASVAAGALFAWQGWSSFGVAAVVAFGAFLTHVALDVLNWGAPILWPLKRDRVDYTVHGGFVASGSASALGLLALEGASTWAPHLVPGLAVLSAGLLVAYLGVRTALRWTAGRRHPGRRLLPTVSPLVWFVTDDLAVGRPFRPAGVLHHVLRRG